MEIRIYQIDPKKDRERVMFEDYACMTAQLGKDEVDASIYGKSFDGTVEADSLEDVYEIFNLEKPDGFKGRSMSVSDVVAVEKEGAEEPEYYYCDRIGFRKIDFDESKAASSFKNRIRVVMCEPGRAAQIMEIGTELEDLQKAVGGLIQTYYPFEEEVCIVCNDEGKINGMRPNRAIFDEDHNIVDIIFGPFFICDASTPEFLSLNPEQLDRYGRMFERPERFFRMDERIAAVPYDPSMEMPLSR